MVSLLDTIRTVPGYPQFVIGQDNRMSQQVWGRRRTIWMMNPNERGVPSMLLNVALFLLGEMGNQT